MADTLVEKEPQGSTARGVDLVNRWKPVTVFLGLSFVFALTVDLAALAFRDFSTAGAVLTWGTLRMWSVALAVLSSMKVLGEDVRQGVRRYLRLSPRALAFYVAAPLIVYAALGVYVALAAPLKFFNFDVYVELIVNQLSGSPAYPTQRVEDLARTLAYSQFSTAFLAAVTINAALALGEELGWRGYLYDKLDGRPSWSNCALIGLMWGLWHAPATLLYGYNYSVHRVLGGFLLFPLLCIFLSYPHMVLVTASHSVLPAASLHGAVNALWSLTLIATNLPVEEREAYLGVGALGVVSWAILDSTLYLLFKLAAKRQKST